MKSEGKTGEPGVGMGTTTVLELSRCLGRKVLHKIKQVFIPVKC